MKRTLSAYELKCGKVQSEEYNHDHLYYFKKELYHENGIYHVRVFKHVKNSSSCDRVSWENFETLKDARAFYKTGKLL